MIGYIVRNARGVRDVTPESHLAVAADAPSKLPRLPPCAPPSRALPVVDAHGTACLPSRIPLRLDIFGHSLYNGAHGAPRVLEA